MKKLRKIMSVMVATMMATFLVGCGGDGDDDDDDQPSTVEVGPRVNAPATLVGSSYSVTVGGRSSTLRFPASNRYELFAPGVSETGSFVASRENDVWTVRTTADNNAANVATMRLAFSAASGGAFTITYPNGATESGNFAVSSGGGNNNTTGGNTNTTGGNTNTTGGDTNTTGGNTNTTNGGTNGGTTGTAPAGLDGRIVRIILSNGPFANSNYTEQFTGATSGTFTIVTGSEGAGNFTYTPSGSTATLVQTYTAPPQAAADGDFDNFTLTFTSANGGTLSGTQKTGNVEHTGVTGTFQFEN